MRRTAGIEQYNQFVEALVWLKPEVLEGLLQEYEFDVTKKIDFDSLELRPALTIPLAYDWYIDYPNVWNNEKVGKILYERKEKVKRLLGEVYSINYSEIDEKDQPDAILNQFNDRAYFYPYDEEMDYYKDCGYNADKKDLELFYYADVYNLKKVIELISQGANPKCKLDGEDAIEVVKARLSSDEIEGITIWNKLGDTGALLRNTIEWSVMNRIICVCEKALEQN